MQIVVNLTSNVIQHSGQDGEFTFAPYLIGGSFMDSNATAETHEIISGVTLPAVYADGCYTYANGVFTVIPNAPLPVPQQVSNSQAMMALYNTPETTGTPPVATNLLALVEAYITTAPKPEQIAFAAATWQRNSPSLLATATALGLTSAQVDQLFIAAAQIVI